MKSDFEKRLKDMNSKYSTVPRLSACQIENDLFQGGLPTADKGSCVYSAVYNLDKAAAVAILKRVLAASELEVQLIALEAIEAFMQSRRTDFGAKELSISVRKFASENPEFAEAASNTLTAISEFEEIFSE